MSNKKQELLTVREHLGLHRIFGDVHVATVFLVFCGVLFLFVILVCVPYLVSNVSCVYGLYILDWLSFTGYKNFPASLKYILNCEGILKLYILNNAAD